MAGPRARYVYVDFRYFLGRGGSGSAAGAEEKEKRKLFLIIVRRVDFPSWARLAWCLQEGEGLGKKKGMRAIARSALLGWKSIIRAGVGLGGVGVSLT